ncbi:MAG: aminoacetone oxidase family FAD-binding enzyme [Vicinamibacterales bacterium]
MNVDIVVIGAGAAGMMAAAQAGRRGRRVVLVDHWRTIGERIRVSGGGRCNFTNRRAGADGYLSQNPRFCRSALARYPPDAFIALVERHGVPYHEEQHGQLFCDRSSQDIIGLLRRECDDAGVRLVHPCAVGRVARAGTSGPSPPGTHGAHFDVVTDCGTWRCEAVVIATGGLAVPLLGATPFGYTVAGQFGIPVVAPQPALVPLALAPVMMAALAPLAGVAFEAEARCGAGCEAPRFVERALVTHRGLSGPAILQISSYWQLQSYAAAARAPVELDLLPGRDARAWIAERAGSRAVLPNLLCEVLPRRLAHGWCGLHGWTGRIDEYRLPARDAMARALNAWTLMPSGTLGFKKAEVTLGGVDTKALSSQTMEARSVPGLYFVGEVVDVTGWLGGYNFQWAWSSGWVAGQYA